MILRTAIDPSFLSLIQPLPVDGQARASHAGWGEVGGKAWPDVVMAAGCHEQLFTTSIEQLDLTLVPG
jgi:hypothetical protein